MARAQAQGFRHEVLGSGHHRFYAPDGRTIVQCSATKGERDNGRHRGFLSEMRKAGYRTEGDEAMEVMRMNGHDGGATTNLGEALKSAREAAPAAAQTMQEIALDVISLRSPTHVGVAEIQLVIKARRPDANPNGASTALNKLVAEGRVVRVGHGVYGLPPSARTDMAQAEARTLAKIAADGPASVALPGAPLPPADCYDDPDQRELDEALAALGRIESVVRRYKAKIAQFKKLKTLLDGVDL